jgi:hypothetical protein
MRAQMTEVKVVSGVVASSGVQYAVIAGLRTETGPERLVIAYPSEDLLREVIATRSIIALGFSSREEAAAGRRASVPTAVTYQRMPEAVARTQFERDKPGLNRAERPREHGTALRRLARFLVASYSDIAATAAIVFCSTNAVSSVIRMALGSSV